MSWQAEKKFGWELCDLSSHYILHTLQQSPLSFWEVLKTGNMNYISWNSFKACPRYSLKNLELPARPPQIAFVKASSVNK